MQICTGDLTMAARLWVLEGLEEEADAGVHISSPVSRIEANEDDFFVVLPLPSVTAGEESVVLIRHFFGRPRR